MFKVLIVFVLFFLGFCKEKDRVLTPSGKSISGLTLFIVGAVKTKSSVLKVGGTILEADTIFVDKKSLADLQILNLQQDIVIRLKENTRFQLKEKNFKNNTTKNIYIESGDALFNVKKINKDDTVNIITPTVAIGIRGTQFGVSIDPKTGASKIALIEGSISVSPFLTEIEEIGEDIFEASGISGQLEEWKKKIRNYYRARTKPGSESKGIQRFFKKNWLG